MATPDRNSEAAPSAKRPRYGGKAFGDFTLAELENAVRDLASLERQLAAKDDSLAKLQEKVSDKSALLRQVKALEGDLAAQQKEAERLQSLARGAVEETKLHAEQVVEAIRKQLAAQMVYCVGFKEQLQKSGREVTAFVPNVSLEVLKALGGEPGGTVNKFSDALFGHRVVKKTTNSAIRLELKRPLAMKYVKKTCELRVDATYHLEPAKRSKAAAKKSPKKQRGADAAGNEEDEEEGGDDEGAEDADGDDGVAGEARGTGGPPDQD